MSSPTEPEGPSSPAKPGQGAEPTPGDPGSALPDLRDPGSNSHKPETRTLPDLRDVPTGKPETRIGKLTYELRKTEIAAEIRKEEIRAELRKAELAEAGDDKENERATQIALDKQRNRGTPFREPGPRAHFRFRARDLAREGHVRGAVRFPEVRERRGRRADEDGRPAGEGVGPALRSPARKGGPSC